MSSRERDKSSSSSDKEDDSEEKKPECKRARSAEDADDVAAVLAKLGAVFRACVRGDGAFALRKFCSACCAGARMLARGVGTETHADAWHATLCAAAAALRDGGAFPATLAALLASTTTGDGYAAAEGSWHGLLEAVEAVPVLAARGSSAWADTLGAWRLGMHAVRAVEAADDALTLDRALAPVLRSVEAAHRAAAAARCSAARDALDEAATAERVAAAQASRDTRAAWMRTAAACATLCLQQTRMFWAPRCLESLVDLLVERRRALFTDDEVRQLEAWRSEAVTAACAKRSGTGTRADTEQANQFERDLHKWQNLDVPRGKSTSSDNF